MKKFVLALTLMASTFAGVAVAKPATCSISCPGGGNANCIISESYPYCRCWCS